MYVILQDPDQKYAYHRTSRPLRQYGLSSALVSAVCAFSLLVVITKLVRRRESVALLPQYHEASFSYSHQRKLLSIVACVGDAGWL